MSKRILCVGFVCVDTVCELPSFPTEDSDQRCSDLRRQTGGNASNTCTVLGILGVKPCFFGPLPDAPERQFIEGQFKEYGVDARHAVIVPNSHCPASFIITSLSSGSRTIVHHNNNKKEVTLEDFYSLDLTEFSWIHFEGRNVEETKRMAEYVRRKIESNELKLTMSIEAEKESHELDELFPLADVVFISKEYAQFKGCNNIEEALNAVSKLIPHRTTLICPWEDKGAGAITGPEGIIYKSPAFSPDHVVDTLGAGDTFIAATILALFAGESVEDSIKFGCKFAGFKVGVKGWKEVGLLAQNLHFVKELKKIKYIKL